jgi:hypothetical protein
MKIKLFNWLATIIAVVFGGLTLLGYFVDVPPLRDARLTLVGIASLLLAWAALSGALNIFLVHLKRLQSSKPGWLYSGFVVLGFLFAIAINLVPLVNLVAPTPMLEGWRMSAGNPANMWLLNGVISPVSGALAGMIAFFLILAGYRLLQRRFTLLSLSFAVAAGIALVGMIPLPALVPDLTITVGDTTQPLRTLAWTWVTQVPATAGARGLLLGIALGTIATGLRHLIGLDRPYGD